MESLEKADKIVAKFAEVLEKPAKIEKTDKLYTGVDLGTAFIVLAVVNQKGEPVAGAKRFAQVVKDGLVVDYVGAVNIVRELKAEIEEKIGRELDKGGVAYPPGTTGGDQNAIGYVAEGAGFEIVNMTDEPSAANEVLEIKNGAVVDIGGGTTGVAVFKDGMLQYVADEPTGGTHFSLVIAGSHDVDFLEAEKMKRDEKQQLGLLPVLKPVMQKMGLIIGNHIAERDVNAVFLAGGTCCFPDIEKVIQKEIGVETVKPVNPFYVTPLGIALSVQRKEEAVSDEDSVY